MNNKNLITTIPCVILSGGKSSRMEEDKSLLPFGNYDSLIQYQHEKLNKMFQNVYISSKFEKFDFNANIILDNDSIYSPLIALRSIFKKLNTDKIFIVPVDTPFIDFSTIIKLIENSEKYDITIARTPLKTHNLCGVFCSSILNHVDNMLDNDLHKIGSLIKNSNSSSILFENEEQFLNINNPNDYSKALSIISSYNNSY